MSRTLGVALLALLLSGCSSSKRSHDVVPHGDQPALADGRPVQPPIAVMLARRAGPSVESIEPWTFGGSAGVLVQTRHYRVYSTLTDPVLMDRLPGFLEQALDRYRSAFAPAGSTERLADPPIKLETYVLRSRSQWEDFTHTLAGQNAATLLRIRRGGYAWGGKGVFYDLGDDDAASSDTRHAEQGATFAIAAHEGWHQYTQRTFAQPLPAWLEEGLATSMEGLEWSGAQSEMDAGASASVRLVAGRDSPRLEALRELAATNKLLRLEELLDTAPPSFMLEGQDAKALAYYAQAWALCRWIEQEPPMRAALWRLLKDAQAGALSQAVTTAAERQTMDSSARFERDKISSLMLRRGPAVFVAYFGADMEAHERAYRAHIDRMTQPSRAWP